MDKKLHAVIEALDEKKGRDIRAYDVSGTNGMWEYFVLCTGTSKPHIRTLYGNVDDRLKEKGYDVYYRDLGRDSDWIIADFGEILVHIFDEQARMYYSIEKLWGENEVDIHAPEKPKRGRPKKAAVKKAGVRGKA